VAGASFATDFNVDVISKLVVGTASGWLKRLLRRFCGALRTEQLWSDEHKENDERYDIHSDHKRRIG
jgi:hypothetical protein